MPELKVCGITDATFACAAARRGVNYLGFIFAGGSPRRITPETARAIREAVELRSTAGASRPRFVGVFVEQTVGEIAETVRRVPLDVIQLHGDFGAREISELKATGCEVWRLYNPVDGGEDALLLDGQRGGRRGGTGCLADWSLVSELKRAGRRVVLAGGISEGNIAAAAATGADVIDVNSSIETSPGVKSVEKLDSLLCAFAR
ncbi:MAG: phosphoribosylanthranilate isomerase [Kiritimatiellae bacterium]|nr:phosphoribosylanthranilate isomerase [Kiritimatiellia bacterium]